MKNLLQLLLLGLLITTAGCQSNRIGDRMPLWNRWEQPVPRSVVENPSVSESKNSIVVSGLVNAPGLQAFNTKTISLRKAVASAGDVQFAGSSKSPIFVAIDRPVVNGIVSHFIPADLLNHPSIREIQLTQSDSVRVVKFEKTTLVQSAGQLETIEVGGNDVPFVEIAVSGIGEPVKVMSDNALAPKLEKLGAAIDDYKTTRQLPPIMLLSRELPSQSRREVYYLPMSSDLYGVISDRPEFLDLTAVFQKLVRLRNGDTVSFSFLQTSPIVVENLLTRVITESESTADENRSSVFSRRQRERSTARRFSIPRLR